MCFHRGMVQARNLHAAAHLNQAIGAFGLLSYLELIFIFDRRFAWQAVFPLERIVKAY